MHLDAEALILDSGGAKDIAVTKQRGCAIQIEQRGIIQQRRLAGMRQGYTHQQIAIAVQQINRGVVRCESMQCADYPGVERIVYIIVTRPVLEQIAQDVKSFGSWRDICDELPQCRHAVRLVGTEMQVGDE